MLIEHFSGGEFLDTRQAGPPYLNRDCSFEKALVQMAGLKGAGLQNVDWRGHLRVFEGKGNAATAFGALDASTKGMDTTGADCVGLVTCLELHQQERFMARMYERVCEGLGAEHLGGPMLEEMKMEHDRQAGKLRDYIDYFGESAEVESARLEKISYLAWLLGVDERRTPLGLLLEGEESTAKAYSKALRSGNLDSATRELIECELQPQSEDLWRILKSLANFYDGRSWAGQAARA